MIFAIETEQRALTVFSSEEDAIAYCEGLDVEAATWMFWGSDGSQLEAEFMTPNKRGLFTVQNGSYLLVPSSSAIHAHLAEALDEVLWLEPSRLFGSLQEVRDHLAQVNNRCPDGA